MLQSRDFRELLKLWENMTCATWWWEGAVMLLLGTKMDEGSEQQDLKDVEAIRRGVQAGQSSKTELGARPNSGPVAPPGNSGVTEGRHRRAESLGASECRS